MGGIAARARIHIDVRLSFAVLFAVLGAFGATRNATAQGPGQVMREAARARFQESLKLATALFGAGSPGASISARALQDIETASHGIRH